jgi:hypothetical protein
MNNANIFDAMMTDGLDDLVENTAVHTQSEMLWQPDKIGNDSKGNEDVVMETALHEAIDPNSNATPAADTVMEDASDEKQLECGDSSSLEFPVLDEGPKARESILTRQATLLQMADAGQSETVANEVIAPAAEQTLAATESKTEK